MAQSNGVLYYTSGVATVPVFFPEDNAVCQWCPFVRSEDTLKRHKCLLTGEYLPYPFTSRGNQCPVQLEEKKEEN